MKNNKGITLVALVITIIVLLILAGVSISMVVGENGVLNRATSAADKTSEADIKSALENAIMGCQGSFVEVWEASPTTKILTWLDLNQIKANIDADSYNVTYDKYTTSGTIQKKSGTENVGKKYDFYLTASGSIGAKVNWGTKPAGSGS